MNLFSKILKEFPKTRNPSENHLKFNIKFYGRDVLKIKILFIWFSSQKQLSNEYYVKYFNK